MPDQKHTSYAELLKDPRWQRKRLERLEAADFACEQCGAKDKTLHVHHTYYEKRKLPWAYEDEYLRVLCEDCHAKFTALLVEAHRYIGGLGFDQLECYVAECQVKAAIERQDLDQEFEFSTWPKAAGIAHVVGVTVLDIIERRESLDAGVPHKVSVRKLLELSLKHGARCSVMDASEMQTILEYDGDDPS